MTADVNGDYTAKTIQLAYNGDDIGGVSTGSVSEQLLRTSYNKDVVISDSNITTPEGDTYDICLMKSKPTNQPETYIWPTQISPELQMQFTYKMEPSSEPDDSSSSRNLIIKMACNLNQGCDKLDSNYPHWRPITRIATASIAGGMTLGTGTMVVAGITIPPVFAGAIVSGSIATAASSIEIGVQSVFGPYIHDNAVNGINAFSQYISPYIGQNATDIKELITAGMNLFSVGHFGKGMHKSVISPSSKLHPLQEIRNGLMPSVIKREEIEKNN